MLQNEGIVHMSSVKVEVGTKVKRESYSFIFLSWGNEKLLMGFKQRCGMFAFEKDNYAFGK